MKRVWPLVLLALAAPPHLGADAVVGYYRFPTLRGDTIVFAAEGDLWRVGREGGVASRLTTHPADETYPSISPDGQTLAFSAAYEGPTEVYTMPLAGGLPVRQTYGGGRVVGWTPDGQVLYATDRYSTLPSTQLVRLDTRTHAETRVPLSQADDGSYTPDGRVLFFTRLPFQGSHTRRYKGGTAQNLWKLMDGAAEAQPLTADYPGTSKAPMWWQGRVYFASDRDGTMNLWSMDDAGGGLRQHTKHVGWDVATPALDAGRIVYRLGADLRIYDIAADRDAPLDVRIASDFDQTRETWVKKPMEYLTSATLSPTGDRVALTARGQVFVAPVKPGRLVEATRRSGVRYRQARFLPAGGSKPATSLVVLSDQSGEVELWTLPASGVGTPKPLTTDGKVLRWDAVPSPDGHWIAHHDKDQQLWLYDTQKQTQTRIAVNSRDDFADLVWSPDSRWLAYVQVAANRFQQIFVHDVQTGQATPATSDRYDSRSPAWSSDGEWLYFLSDRNLTSMVDSPWGPRQPDPFIGAPTEIYAVALGKERRSPFAPADEVHADAEKKEEKKEEKDKDKDKDKKDDKSGKSEAKTPAPVIIDRAGLAERLVPVPVPAGRYDALKTDGKRLYWLARDLAPEPKRALKALAIGRDKPEVKTVMEDVRSYQLSADGKKVLVRKTDDIYVFDAADKAPEKDKLEEAKLDLSGWTFSFDPREQWRQMFTEAWRLERDYFYDPAMHGLDWPAVRAKYEPLVTRVATRGDLNDLLAQMVSELSALHIFVRGGDVRKGTETVEVASLGADWTRDEPGGGYRVVRIYRADPDLPGKLSPLRQLAVGVAEGDVIESVNGVRALDLTHPEQLLRNQAGRQVLLHVRPKTGEARDVVAVPLSRDDAADLRYTDWEYSRRLQVEKAGEGKIGYVHLRAMGQNNFTEWAREYYPVFDRAGLILDVRANRGGNIDSWILGKLLRKAWFYWKPRVGDATWNMQYAFRGHMVVLVDERTASDGEAFAEGFRRLGLGKVIGTRTWGGEIWLSSSNVLLDRGIATAAEFGVYGPEGEWLIEGHGVEPDVVVDNLPKATFEGRDAQLEAALRYLQDKIAAEPLPVPPSPAYPKKMLPPPAEEPRP
jgi:tricorn protease